MKIDRLDVRSVFWRVASTLASSRGSTMIDARLLRGVIHSLPNNCPYGFMEWFDYAAESAFSFANTSALNDTKSACNVTRGIITSTSSRS
jgi:hypothetical protein